MKILKGLFIAVLALVVVFVVYFVMLFWQPTFVAAAR